MNWSNVYLDPLYRWGALALPLFFLLYLVPFTRDLIGSLVVDPVEFRRAFDFGTGIYERRYGYEANMSLFTFSNYALHFLFLEFALLTLLAVFRPQMVPDGFFTRQETKAFMAMSLLGVLVLCFQPSYACDVILSGCFFGYIPWTMLIAFAALTVVLVPSLAAAIVSLPKLLF